MMRALAGLAMLACLIGTSPSEAQDVAQVDDIVVTARRAGAPMWIVTQGESTVILVGAISGVPSDFHWRSEALEAATVRSQRILYPTDARLSANDVLRLIWRMRTIYRLPKGTTTADYLSPELQARLEIVMEGEPEAWRTKSLVALGLDLMEKGGRTRGTSGSAAAVTAAARRAGLSGQAVGVVRGDDLIEGLISGPPQQYVPCIAAAVAAAEAGPEGARTRLEYWRDLKVPELLANPLEQAYDLCWPSGDPDVAPLQREQWREATQIALSLPETTVGVAAVRVLAEPGGVLDQLKAQGFHIEGPPWTAEP